jgi:peptide/nickel transport system substrate-binding protein
MLRVGAVLGGVVLAMSAACGTMAQAQANAPTLRIGLQEDPDGLDPMRATTYVSRLVFNSLCDKLVDIDAKLEIVPRLATSWSWNADNTVLTMKLRDDAYFHDGAKFDAVAAKANLDRNTSNPESKRKSELQSVQKVDAPDPQTLVITLKQPDAALLSQLSDRAGMMLSPASFAGKDTGAVARSPVCSGPYKFVERVQNDRIVLDKFDKYYDAKDYHFGRLVFLPIPDGTVRLQNLRAGSLDMLERLNPSDVQDVKGDPNLKFASVSGLGWQELVYNYTNGPGAVDNPLNDVRVRQALSLSIDREAIDQVVGGGIFEPAGQPFPPSSPYYDKAWAAPKRDVAKARALLKAAGKPQVRITMVYGNSTQAQQMAEMIQAMAREAGIEIALQPADYAAMLSLLRQGKFQVGLRGWSGRADPDSNIHPFMYSKGELNDGRYDNPEVDKLLDQARTVTDEVQRKALYDHAQDIVRRDEAGTFVVYQPWPFVLGKKIQGFTPYPDGMIRLKGVQYSQ